jgi:signal transduction histidine kinase
MKAAHFLLHFHKRNEMTTTNKKANKNLSVTKRKLKPAAELIIANKELIFQNEEKEKRAAELVIADKELVFQNEEKENRAAELIVANKELIFQNREKEKRADELIIANKELAFQNEEKEKRAAELIIANKELAYQNEEKENRAAELVIANKELAFQNDEKEKRAAELIVANKELLFQNREKEKRADEFKKLNQELEQRVIERTSALEKSNKELESFSYSVSHDLRAPLRHIDGFIELLKKKIFETADDSVKRYLNIISQASIKLSCLIDKEVGLSELVKEVITELKPQTENRKINWQLDQLPKIQADYNLIKLVYQNLIGNSIKFTGHKEESEISLTAKEEEGRYLLTVKDNGAGFDMAYSERLFGVFQRLHRQDEFEGTGIGLANVRRIVQMHNGDVWAEGKVNEGAELTFTIPKINNQ